MLHSTARRRLRGRPVPHVVVGLQATGRRAAPEPVEHLQPHRGADGQGLPGVAAGITHHHLDERGAVRLAARRDPGFDDAVDLLLLRGQFITFLETRAWGNPHPSPLAGAMNVQVPRATHGSFLRTDKVRPRIEWDPNGLKIRTNTITRTFECGTEVARDAAAILLDTKAVVAGNSQLACGT